MPGSELDATLAIASDPDRLFAALAEQLLETSAVRDPLLRDLMLYAALPRSFDAALLAGLAGTDVEDPGFVASLDRLVAFPFVHERVRDGWALHDTVRTVLTDNWRTRTEAPLGLDQQMVRLGELYGTRYARARLAVVALGQVEGVIRAAREERYSALAGSVTDRLIRAAVELVHTALRRSPTAGFETMHGCFTELESYRLHRSCRALARGWASDESLLPEEARPLHRAWGAYFAARTANNRAQPEKALEILDGVEHPEGVDLKYGTWHHSEVARALRELSRFREALGALDREIAIHAAHHIDDVNSWTPWTSKADLYGLLWDSADEIRCAEQAVAHADNGGSIGGRVSTRLLLAEVTRADGDLEAGTTHLLTALRLARSAIGQQPVGSDRYLGRAASSTALTLLGPRSTRIVAVLTEQYRQLVVEEGPDGVMDNLLRQARALVVGGDRRRAMTVYAELGKLAGDTLPKRKWEVDAALAEQAVVLGIPFPGGELNLALLDEPLTSRDPWTRGRLLGNAVGDFLGAGALDRAGALIDDATALWEGIDHPNALGYITVFRAELERRRGDLAAARATLAGIDTRPGRGYDGFRLAALAQLEGDEHALDQASDHAVQAYEIAAAIGEDVDALERGLFAVSCLVKARRLDAAIELNARLTVMVESLRTRLDWTPTSRSRLADEHAGRAVRILVAGYGPREARVRSAIEHLDEALRLDPTPYWFSIEAALAESMLGRPRQQAKRLTDAMDQTDDLPVRKAIAAMRAGL